MNRERAKEIAREVKRDSKVNLEANKTQVALVWRVRKKGRRPRMALKLARKLGKDEYGLILQVAGLEIRIAVDRQKGSNNYVKVIIDADRDLVKVIREEKLEELEAAAAAKEAS